MNKWKVWWMIESGTRIWRVYRLIDPMAPDEPENREYDKPTFGNEQIAQDYADVLNGDKVEDKEVTVRLMFAVLKSTREYKDLVDLQYKCDNWKETVIAKYELRLTEAIDVTADSCIAIIDDISDQLKLERWKAWKR